jgi:flavorubredoxin
MKALILFDTQFGNTEAIAYGLAKGLQDAGVESECTNIDLARMDNIAAYDLLAMGAPTQYLSASKPMKEFLRRLEVANLKGKYGFAFDTKLDSPLSGSAAKFIEKKLKELGLEIIKPRISAIVFVKKESKEHGAKSREETVLKDGMQELFEKVGTEIGVLLLNRKSKKEVEDFHDTA